MDTNNLNKKDYIENRDELLNKMQEIVEKAKEEKRAMSTEEQIKFDDFEKEIKNIDSTLKKFEQYRNLENLVSEKENNKENNEEKTEKDKFLRFLKGEQRALDISSNGAIIPTTIASKIIEKVKELSPIYSMATVYNLSGDLTFPIYDDENSAISASYVDDMTELIEHTGKFTTTTLTNNIIGCLVKISKSLVNRTDFDLTSFSINKVSKAFAEFLEKELITGTIDKLQGLSSINNIITSISSDKIVADELIDLQMSIPEIYQNNACWIMNKSTLKSLRKLKDNDGNYLLGNMLNGFGYELLGKKVYITESCDELESGKIPIYYGDMSGLYVKLTKNLQIQVLMEKYATQYAIGIIGYMECDSKIIEPQKLVCLKMKS